MDPCYNHTSFQERMDFSLQLLVGSCLAVLIVITLCGNIIVCLAVTLDRRLRSLTNCIIVSLAITDLLLGLLVLPFSAFYELTKEWPFGSTLCNIYSSLDVMLCTASILNLFMISLDRYFAVTTPLRYSQLVTPSRVAVGLAVIWTVSLMVSFLPIHLGWNTNGTAVQNTVPSCNKECTLEVNPVYGLVDALLTFYIPLVIMCITYYRILKIAREQAKRINHTWCCSSNTPMPPMVKEHKATVTLAVVLGAFIVCWFPYFTVFTYRGMWGDSRVKGTPMSIVLWLGYANSALNPILYGTLNRDFRVAYQHLLHCSRTGGPRSSRLPPLQKAQSRGRSCRQGQGRQEGKPLKLEVRNGKGILLTDGALKRQSLISSPETFHLVDKESFDSPFCVPAKKPHSCSPAAHALVPVPEIRSQVTERRTSGGEPKGRTIRKAQPASCLPRGSDVTLPKGEGQPGTGESALGDTEGLMSVDKYKNVAAVSEELIKSAKCWNFPVSLSQPTALGPMSPSLQLLAALFQNPVRLKGQHSVFLREKLNGTGEGYRDPCSGRRHLLHPQTLLERPLPNQVSSQEGGVFEEPLEELQKSLFHAPLGP